MEIKSLAVVPEYFDNVFDALYSEWGDNNPNYWKEWIKTSMNEVTIPITFVVLNNKDYVGTFSLWNCDNLARQDLSPWVGGIVVDKKYRGQGIGLYIQHQIKKILFSMKIKKAYLFTELNNFYEKTGWTWTDDSFDEKDHKVKLYELEIKE